jgi:hypothetical protein
MSAEETLKSEIVKSEIEKIESLKTNNNEETRQKRRNRVSTLFHFLIGRSSSNISPKPKRKTLFRGRNKGE